MASAYTLLSANSTVQTLSPTLAVQAVDCWIKTAGHGAVVNLVLSKDSFDANQGHTELTNFADAVEQILSGGKAIAAVGTSDLDAAGLRAVFVTFTVGYQVPGSNLPPATVDVDVPAGELNFTDGLIGATLLEDVLAIIDGAYSKLVALAGG
jgi:hypothetical protein